jgi:antitoxin VapB
MPLPTPKTARLFTNGGSQAVSLPAEFRFSADRVYVRRDTRTGDVILSAEPRASWADFMALRTELGPFPEDFLADRQQGSETRDPLAGWRE